MATTRTAAKKAPVKKAPAKKAAPVKKAAAKKPAKSADGTHSHTTTAKTKVEADEPEFREPIRPTPKNIAELKHAVVMLAWDTTRPNAGDYGAPTDRDMDGTNDIEMARGGFEGHLDWATEDVAEYGDIWHAVILIEDTKTMEFNRVEVVSTDDEWKAGATAFLKEYPETIFSRTKRDRIKKAAEPSVKKVAGVKKTTEAPKTVGKAPVRSSKNALAKLAAEMTDEELSELTIDQVEQLPKHLKGKAMALRSKRVREARAAKAPAKTTTKAEPEAPKTIAKKAPAKRPRAKVA